MKLITKEIANRMPFRYAQEKLGEDAIVHLKLFGGRITYLVTSAVKYVTTADGGTSEEKLSYELKEGEKVEDVHLYGHCNIGYGYEFGPVALSEIEAVNKKRGFNYIEREKWDSNGKRTVKELKR